MEVREIGKALLGAVIVSIPMLFISGEYSLAIGPLALAGISIGSSLLGSLFGPKSGQRQENISGQIDPGGKFNLTFEELLRALRGDTEGGSLAGLREALAAQSEFQLGQGASRLSGQLGKRGLAGSPVLGANIGQLGQRLALGEQSQFSQALISGRNQALSSLPGLVGQGLGTARGADISQTNRANQFSSGFGDLTQALIQALTLSGQGQQARIPS